MTPVPSKAFASKQVTPNAEPRLRSVVFSWDPALASGTYYAIVLNNGLLGTPGTEPTNATDLTATAKLLLFCAPFVHTLDASEVLSVNCADYGFQNETAWPGTGFMFLISTTAPTSYTSAGAHVWTNATVQ